MRKKVLAWLLLLSIIMLPLGGLAEEKNEWMEDSREQLVVGNPTPLRGCFFTEMWGGTTSDLDVQDLLHAYSPVVWDKDLVRYRYDHSVVQNAIAMNDKDGNRTYVLVFYEDLQFSNGARITAYDYAFSILLGMDKAVTECGGQTQDYSWLVGSDEYLSGETKVLSGVKVITDQMMQIQVKAEALPYFYELSRLDIRPYPIEEIAPGVVVFDEGEGIYLSEPLTGEMLKKTVTDRKTGYLSHPKTVSGPYTLKSFDGKTATFERNPKYKGNEDGWKPEIRTIRYTLAENRDMIRKLKDGEFGLLNKVTMGETIRSGLRLQRAESGYDMTRYKRTGLTLIRYMENSIPVQELAVRKAIALCFDRERYIQEYAGPAGVRMDAFCGIGQWMYRLAKGQMVVSGELAEKIGEEAITLDGVKQYGFSIADAKKKLTEAGWTLNENGGRYEEGVRYKEINGELVGLKLTMGMPESGEARDLLERYLLPNLEKAGIQLALKPVDMELIEKNYEEKSTYDLLYLGENFSIYFDTQLMAPDEDYSGNLTDCRRELAIMARKMVRTEPTDVVSFMKKWVELQEKISETLPVLPVYSNDYFDFYTRELHQYRITDAVTWGEAIVRSYMSDIEEMDEEAQQKRRDEVTELEKQFDEQGD